MELLGPSKTSLKISFVLDSTEVQIYNYNIIETDWDHNRHSNCSYTGYFNPWWAFLTHRASNIILRPIFPKRIWLGKIPWIRHVKRKARIISTALKVTRWAHIRGPAAFFLTQNHVRNPAESWIYMTLDYTS